MIQIINGTYGYKRGGVLVALNADSAPVTLDPDEEQRLVDQSVAEYVNDSDYAPTVPSLNMSRKELDNIAAEYGVDSAKFAKKEQVIEAINEAMKDDDI